TADAVVRVEVAVHEAAAMEEDEQRVGTSWLGGLVVAGGGGGGGGGARGAGGGQRPRASGGDTAPAPPAPPRGTYGPRRHAAPCVTRRQSLQGPLATLQQRQHELHLRGERFAVDAHRLPSGQAHLSGGRKRGKGARETVPKALQRPGSGTLLSDTRMLPSSPL